jgi:hypothetical protein
MGFDKGYGRRRERDQFRHGPTMFGPQPGGDTNNSSAQPTPPADPPANSAGERPKSRFPFIDHAEFMAGDYRPRWLVPRILVRNQPGVIAGPSKGMKTSTLVDLAVSMATATPFLGTFPVRERVRVALCSGESGQNTLQETAARVQRSRGLTSQAAAGWLKWEFSLPCFTDAVSMSAFAGDVARVEADVLVIDPTYLVMGDVDAKNLFEMGKALTAVQQFLLKARPDLTVLLVHHANRALPVGEPMELQHLAYSGIEQFARQFIFLNRREPYANDGEHDIWMRAGGSAGHGGLWAVHISEGIVDEDFSGRRWDVSVKTTGEAKEAVQKDREAERRELKVAERQQNERAVLQAIDAEQAAGKPGATANRIADLTTYSRARVGEVLARLERAGAVEPVEFDATVGKGATKAVKGWRRATD